MKGKVIGIKDGDTIEVLSERNPITIRLAHIDCPEIRKSQPFGKAAKQLASDLCYGQNVRIIHTATYDRNKRLIAEIINEHGINVNQELVRAGLAWHFKRYSNDSVYARLETEARKSRVGLWQDENPVPPWKWRK